MTSVIMVGNMLPKLLVLVAVTVADIKIDINISGEEEAAVRENSKGRNTTSTVLNNSNNNLREVAENCSVKKVWTDITFTFTIAVSRLGWESLWCSAS